MFVVAMILGIMATATLRAQTTFTVGIFNYEVNPDGTTVTVTGYDGSEVEDLVIPTAVTYEGTDYAVTDIGSYSFFMQTNLTGSLTLPDSMTLIDDYAFCSPFTGELVIPNSVTEIYSYAFTGSKFSSITIGENVTKIWQNANMVQEFIL